MLASVNIHDRTSLITAITRWNSAYENLKTRIRCQYPNLFTRRCVFKLQQGSHTVCGVFWNFSSVFTGQAPLLKPDPDAQWKPLSCTVGHSPGVQVGADTLSSGVAVFSTCRWCPCRGNLNCWGTVYTLMVTKWSTLNCWGIVYTLMVNSWGNLN